jgi:hypothetical protein
MKVSKDTPKIQQPFLLCLEQGTISTKSIILTPRTSIILRSRTELLVGEPALVRRQRCKETEWFSLVRGSKRDLCIQTKKLQLDRIQEELGIRLLSL